MKCNMPGKYDAQNMARKYGKNADPRLIEIAENLDKMKIGVDDTFEFGCRACGKCCTHRSDIILSPRDIYNIAKELNMSPGNVYFEYCERYIGGSSRVPIAKLISVGADQHCPLLKDRKCSVHKAKPTVCALYPLGRGINTESGENMKAKDIYYILQPSDCNCKKETHTVREWVESFGIPVQDQYYVEWMGLVSELSAQFREYQKAMDPEKLCAVYEVVSLAMYYSYSIRDSFEPQFEINCRRIREIMAAVADSEKGEKSDA